jgi:hypothetical protein
MANSVRAAGTDDAFRQQKQGFRQPRRKPFLPDAARWIHGPSVVSGSFAAVTAPCDRVAACEVRPQARQDSVHQQPPILDVPQMQEASSARTVPRSIAGLSTANDSTSSESKSRRIFSMASSLV